jgi:hypothetical protein
VVSQLGQDGLSQKHLGDGLGSLSPEQRLAWLSPGKPWLLSPTADQSQRTGIVAGLVVLRMI